MLKAPWDDDQVASLNAYQKAGVMHPFTHEGEDLMATKDGWVLPNDPVEVVQDWAPPWMTNWSWVPEPGTIGALMMPPEIWAAAVKAREQPR